MSTLDAAGDAGRLPQLAAGALPIPPLAGTGAIERATPTEDSREAAAGRGVHLAVMAVLAVLIVACCTAGAYLLGTRQAPRYAARTELLHSTQHLDNAAVAERAMANQRALLTSPAVLGPVAEDAGLELAALTASVAVEVPPGSDLLRVTVTAPERAEARALAAGINRAYLLASAEATPSDDEQAMALVRTQVEAVEQRLAKAQARLAELQEFRAANRLSSPGAEERQLQAVVAFTPQRLATLQDRLLLMQVDTTGQPQAQVLTTPFDVAEPVAPQPLRAGAAGAMAGLVLATAVAVVLRRPRAARPGS